MSLLDDLQAAYDQWKVEHPLEALELEMKIWLRMHYEKKDKVMDVIYPQATLDLLAECDSHISEILERYQRLAQQCASAHIYVPVDWQRKVLEDAEYQAYMSMKAKVISLSTCTYQFDAGELNA